MTNPETVSPEPVEGRPSAATLLTDKAPTGWKARLLALLLGALSAFGMAPLFWWPLTIAAMAALVWLIAVRREGAFAAGWWFGLGHFAVGLNWLPTAFGFQAKMPAFLGWIALLLLSGLMAFYPALAAWAARRIGGARLGPLVLAFAGCWTLAEWLRATLFTGFAWNPLAEVALPMMMAGPARFIGTYGVSALLLLVAGSWAAIALRQWRSAAMALVLPLLFAGADMMLPAGAGTPGPQVTLVQPNIGQEVKWESEAAAANFAKLAALTVPKSPDPRLILWTEAAFPDYLETGYPDLYYSISPQMARDRIIAVMNPDDAILTGALKLHFDTQGNVVGARNSIFAMDADGRLTGRYDKAHLLPFGEYVPLRSLLEPLGLSRFAPGDIDFIPGPGPRSIDMGRFGKVGLVICYELIFSGQVVDRADRPAFIFSPSNDAWFGHWGAPQHHAQGRLRAIEEGLPVLRVTPTGISGIVDADGRTVADIPQGQAGRIDAGVPAAHAPTLFSQQGNRIPLLLASILVLLAFALARRATSS